MLLDAIVERFIDRTPLAVAVRGTLEYALAPVDLDALFDRAAGPRADRELLFSACVDLMAAVVCRVRPSVHAAYRADGRVPVSVAAVYARLARVPAAAGRDLVRHRRPPLSRVAGGYRLIPRPPVRKSSRTIPELGGPRPRTATPVIIRTPADR